MLDITHIPHVNFYINSLAPLEEYFNLKLVARPRGNLVKIIEADWNLAPDQIIGKHRKSLLGKIADYTIRDIEIYDFIKTNKIDYSTTIGGISTIHMSHFSKIPCTFFTDDLEYKSSFKLSHSKSSLTVIPDCFEIDDSRIIKYSGFKELANLHPDVFNPNPLILDEYSLKENNFVLIREQLPVSLVYRDARIGQLREVAKKVNELGLKLVFSLEGEDKRNDYESMGIILEEPVIDFHSLLYYSSFVISSGDSLAREAALLGTPAIYTGGRDMKINEELINIKCLFKQEESEKINKIVNFLVSNNYKQMTKEIISEKISREWVKTSEVITKVLRYQYEKDSNILNGLVRR